MPTIAQVLNAENRELPFQSNKKDSDSMPDGEP